MNYLSSEAAGYSYHGWFHVGELKVGDVEDVLPPGVPADLDHLRDVPVQARPVLQPAVEGHVEQDDERVDSCQPGTQLGLIN